MPVEVLIVDDSAAIRKILQRVLRQANIPLGNVLEAEDGVEALKTLSVRHVDLILADVKMPRMNGLQLLAHLRQSEKWRFLPIVMISSQGEREQVIEAVMLGASAYVRKPFTAEQ